VSSLLLGQISGFSRCVPWLSLSILDLRSGQSRERFGEPDHLPNIMNNRLALAAMILTVNVIFLSKPLDGVL